MLEIFVIVYGIIVMVRGKSTMSKNQELLGWRARVIGAILLAYLPVSFGIGLVMGLSSGGNLNQGAVLGASVVVLILVLVAAYFVSKSLYRGQVEEQNQQP